MANAITFPFGYIFHFRIFYSISLPDIVVVVADTVLSTKRDKARRIILRLMVTVVIIGNLITIFFQR